MLSDELDNEQWTIDCINGHTWEVQEQLVD